MRNGPLYDTIERTYLRELRRAVAKRRADLDSGYWPERDADVLACHTAELGARLLVA